MPIKPDQTSKPASAPKTEKRRKPFKIIAISIAAILALIILIAIVLPFIITPNDFKPRIARLVKDKTGRELTITGDIKLSIFPWLGAEIGRMSLSNAPGFGDTPFASIDETDMHVRFWPLLRGHIEVGTIKLVGLDLDLARDSDGHNNWQDILEHLKNPGAASQPQNTGAGSNGLEDLRVAGLELDNSGVRWSDAQKHQQYTISNLDMGMGAFASGIPLRMNTEFDFAGTNPSLTGHAAFKGTLTADMAKKIYTISNAKLDVNANGDAVAGGQVSAELLWQQAALNMDVGTLALNDLSASAYGMKMQADMEGQGLMQDPRYNGSIKLAAFSPRAVLQALGHNGLANTRDPMALSQASGSLDFIASPDAVNVQNLNFKLDDTTLSGSAAIKDLKTRALTFTLTLDQLNADRYLPPQKAATPTQPREATDINKVSIPIRTLRGLNLDGQLHVGQFTLLGVHTSNMDVSVSAHQGVMRINPLSLQLYGGSLNGTAQIDASSDTPIVTEDISLHDLQSGGLIQDLFNVKRLSGTMNMHITTRGLGPTVSEIRHTLQGRMNFSLKDGAIEGLNIWNAVERAYALAKGLPPPPPAPDRTEFADVHGSAVIRNGVLDNRDFVAQLPFMQLTGAGKLDLAELTLDYNLRARITGSPKLGAHTDLSGLAGNTIPVRITGTLSNLSVRPDIGEAARARVQSEVNTKKTELRDKAKKKLQDLLHPPG
jgi:AsmA protein